MSDDPGADEAFWVPVLDPGSGPRYAGIVDALAADLASGRLRPGQRLPTHRALAQALGIDLTTVTRAYGEARRRGLIEATVGRGTFARSTPPSPSSAREFRSSPIDLTMNQPPQPPAARLAERFAAGLAALQARPDFLTLLNYRQGTGSEEDRAAGAMLLRSRLGNVHSDRVVVCAGAQSALLVLLTGLLGPGDTIVAEDVTYPGLRSLAAQLRIGLTGVPLDSEGLVPEALEAACRRERPRALYCVPTIQNPTTATLSAGRRAAIAEIARRHDLLLIEDDPYGLLPSAPPPPLARFAPERTFHIAGLAKALTPGLRVAYIVMPEASSAALTAKLVSGIHASSVMAPPLMAAIATQWIHDGSAQAILSAVRDEAAERQRLARACLPDGCAYAAHPEGHHLWLSLPDGWSRIEFAGFMRQQGVAVVASDAFAVGDRIPSAVRVCLGATPPEVLPHALARLAETLDRGPASLSNVI